jgi:quercetin dioxygenase-like cupin family protein
MFKVHSADGYGLRAEGVEMKTLVYGEHTLMAEYRLYKGHVLPRHAHPYEQTGYLVKGHIRLSVGSEVYDARPGDSWSIPMDVEHGADVIEDTVAIEVFSPARRDYMPQEPPAQA